MDDEKLITLVQNKDLLYNKRSPAYKLAEAKRNAWREIAVSMGYPDEMCKKRWTSLRDRYAREKKLDDQPSGSGSSYRYRWELMSALEFLSPHVVPRPMRSSINILDEYMFSSVSSPLTVEIPSSPESSCQFLSPIAQPAKSSFTNSLTPITSTRPPTPSPNAEINIATPTSSPDEDIITDSTPFISPSNNKVLPKRKRQSESADVEFLFSEAVSAFKKVCELEEERKNNEENDSLQGFGKMVVSTIGTMSSRNQVIAMQRVTALVMSLKLELDE